jgi:hypothetical protein
MVILSEVEGDEGMKVNIKKLNSLFENYRRKFNKENDEVEER